MIHGNGPGPAYPTRVAAQVASGIGFIDGGLIFVRRDTVRGLTTAASVWVSAAIGLACGAGAPELGSTGLLLELCVTFLLPTVSADCSLSSTRVTD